VKPNSTLGVMRAPSLLTSIWVSTVLAVVVVAIAGFYSMWETYSTGSAPLATVFVLPFLVGAATAVDALPKGFHWISLITGMLAEILVVLVVIHGIRYFVWHRSGKRHVQNSA
jgi:hypothetical protein